MKTRVRIPLGSPIISAGGLLDQATLFLQHILNTVPEKRVSLQGGRLLAEFFADIPSGALMSLVESNTEHDESHAKNVFAGWDLGEDDCRYDRSCRRQQREQQSKG